jgi:hypothetical protein
MQCNAVQFAARLQGRGRRSVDFQGWVFPGLVDLCASVRVNEPRYTHEVGPNSIFRAGLRGLGCGCGKMVIDE